MISVNCEPLKDNVTFVPETNAIVLELVILAINTPWFLTSGAIKAIYPLILLAVMVPLLITLPDSPPE